MRLKKIFFLLKNIKKIKFKFNKEKIILFDGTSLNHLQYILKDFKYFVIEDRIERIDTIYFTPSILFYSLKYIYLIIEGYSLKLIYTISLIKSIDPKVIATSIDNSINFFLISKILKKKIFLLAIQNSNRYIGTEKFQSFLNQGKIFPKNYRDLFYIPNYICFGENVKKHIIKNKLKVDKYFTFGSLRIGNFLHHVRENNIKLDKKLFDICFISEPVISNELSGFKEIIIKLLKFSIKISITNNLKFIFANKYIENTEEYKKEMNFYKTNLDDHEFNFLINNKTVKKNIYSSYLALFQSNVSIGCQSTMLLQKMSCKEKILSCNMSNDKIYDFEIKGICSIFNPSYDDFQSRVKMILSINNEEYLKKLDNDPNYYLNFDEKENIIDKIRSLINTNLN